MQVKSRPWMTFSTSRSFSSATRISSSQTVTVAVTKACPIASEPSSCNAASASIALLWASVSSKRRGFVGHHLLQDRGDRFALGKPLPPDFCQQPRGIGLVEHDRAGRPAIGEGEPVELVENPGRRGGRETDDRQHPQMRIAQASARGRQSAAGRPARRRDTSEFRARERAGAWSRPSNADRSAFPRHRAIRSPA